MAKKMYYTEDETAAKLGISADEIANYIRDDRLRVFQDGDRKMFKAEEVDALVGGETQPSEPAQIELAPADEVPTAEPESGDVVMLGDTGEPMASGAEDTVITAEGISIFDEEDLEIEAADPMAKTQIAPSLEDQIAIEGVGSGSGLLDLTRESDDTSLGAEVLDHIDMDEVGSGMAAEEAGGAVMVPEAAVMEAPTYVEAIDPAAGAFGGLLIGGSVVMFVLGAVMLSAMIEQVPPYLEGLKANIVPVVIGSAVVVIISTVAGYFVAKSVAVRREALRQVGR